MEKPTEIAKPETINDITFVEVHEGEEGYDTAQSIMATPEDGNEKIRQKFIDEHWWLQEYWQQKELTEQVVIRRGDHQVSVYNFSTPLDREQVAHIEGVISVFSTLKKGEVLQRIQNVLIDDIQPPNPFTGGDMNGYSSRGKAVILYPRAMEPIEHRVQGVSNLEGTLIHELAHNIGTEFENAWREKFAWISRETPEKMPGGANSYEYTDEPERCVSEYARINAAEDICESMVAAVKAPTVLDQERLQFIQSELLGEPATEAPTVDVVPKEHAFFPKIGKPVLYKLKKKGMFSIKK